MEKPIKLKLDIDFFMLLKAVANRFDIMYSDRLETVERSCDADTKKDFCDVKRDWSYPIGIELNA